MTGHAARFNEWAKIRDRDGEFLERIAPGTFRNAIRSHAAGRPVKVLFQHGKDPSIGEKPLGPVEKLHEDDRGLFYAVRLLDTSYNRDLAQLLEAGLLGASFRFRVKSEDYVARPRRSEWNPDALPERTIRDVALSEFGPVTFPAYPSASATIDATTGLAAVPEPPPRRSARTQPDVPRAWRADRREPAAQRPRAWQPLETRRAR
jgi:HK97 family phage prohead protease